MSGRAGTRRGRRAGALERRADRRRPTKKPKYLQERERSRRGTAACPRPSRGYDPSAADARDSEYHYGSDFGDDTAEESEADERLADSPSSSESPDDASDSDFSLGGRSLAGDSARRPAPPRAPSPEPLWLQSERRVPPLELPPSSADLIAPERIALRAVGVYEALRRFRHLARLSPFRLEDLCAAISCEEQSALLVEVHVALLRALLREEDSQQTHFGPIDHKDSVNVALYLLDSTTWPEALRAYVESDPGFDRDALRILDSCEYPFAGPEERIKILEFLCGQFLTTNPVREDLTSEVYIHYDEHCRACHRFGDLLCCETCPAVFHLECVDPPLLDVPSEDWQCSLCKTHRLQGVTDCVSDSEKQGLLCRHEQLGYDRHGRKYWFLCRRIFIEGDDDQIWYYSTIPQFEELLYVLDSHEMESSLCRELMELKPEIMRQMEITEKITDQLKGSRKSYIEVENSLIIRMQKERAEKKAQRPGDILKVDEDERDDDSTKELPAEIDDAQSSDVADVSTLDNVDGRSLLDASETKTVLGSITDEAKSKIDDKLTEKEENQRITRLKVNQIVAGTLLYKLGNENNYKNYVNQYTTNAMALNKIQRNEERDKKRHLAHKFSLSCAQEFKWIGVPNATRAMLVNTLRQTLLQLESNIASVFMHPNWSLLRKPWLQAVHASNVPRDFARAMVVLQACIKHVVFVPVWHEQLGHVRLQRITAAEREERKKLDKREKKEKEEEEEKNKVSFFVKYPIPLKHQIWKQKGEEYRIHGQWGWLWHSVTRKFRNVPNHRPGLNAGPQKLSIQVKIDDGFKVIVIDPKTYEYLIKKDEQPDSSDIVPQDVKALKPVEQPKDFDEIDIEKALSSPMRIYYPKIAKKSRLDDILARRVNLKVMEERNVDQNIFLQKKEEPNMKEDEDQNVDVENDESENENSLLSTNPNDSIPSSITTKEDVANMTKEIQTLRQQYSDNLQLAKNYKCYTKGCNASSASLSQGLIFTLNCYSPLCIRKANLRKKLILLLNKVRSSTNCGLNTYSSFNSVKDSSGAQNLQQHLKLDMTSKEYANDVFKDLIAAVASAQKYDEKYLNTIVKLSDKKTGLLTVPKTEPVDKSFVFNSETKSEQVLEESVIPAVGNEMELDQGDVDVGYLDVESDKVTDNIEFEKKIKKERKYRDVTYVKQIDEGEVGEGERPPIPKLRISTRGRTSRSSTITSSSENHSIKNIKPLYRALTNRRFNSIKTMIKREENPPIEKAPDGSIRIYSAVATSGRLYLKRINLIKKKRIPVKYPLCSTFHTKSRAKSIMVLPAHELRKLARHGGRLQVFGFNHNSKPNSAIWPYPCSRPLFKTCWLYRTINLSSLAAVALQIRILWTSIRWDDMATKPSNNDGKHQITTETEIISLEMLKHRHTGQFLDKTQYLRRKVVIPLEVPKTVREVTSIRSGLRKRKRAESPQSMEPQVSEEWVDEDKLELWEIKQYGEKVERAVPITRTSTGKLPPSRNMIDSKEGTPFNNASKASAQEIKDKMEQQLRMQRAAHQQKRALEMSQAKQKSDDSNAGVLMTGNKNVIGTRRLFMTKGADGTSRVVSQPTAILPKTPLASPSTPGQQSLIKSQPNQPAKEGPQKVQIIRGPDGKITVRGLISGQQLLQMPDGKLHVIASGQSGNIPAGGQIIATGGAPPIPKIVVSPAVKPHAKIQPVTTPTIRPTTAITTTTPTITSNKVIIRQQTPIKPLNAIQTPDKPVQQTTQRIVTQGTQQLILQGNQQILVQSPQHVVVQGQPRLVQPPLVQVSQGSVLQQNNRPVQTVVVQGTSPQVVQGQVVQGQMVQGQVVQGQVVQGQQIIQNQIIQGGQVVQGPSIIQGQQIVRPVQSQQILTPNTGQAQVINRMIAPGQQILINNPMISQQLAAGKLQLATISGQQVLIRPVGGNHAIIVAQISSSQNNTPSEAMTQIQNAPNAAQSQPIAATNVVNVSSQPTPTNNQVALQSAATPQPAQILPAKQESPIQSPTAPPLTEEQLTEQRLLAGQPPGTVIKTVTAQVVHLDGGPRIVLQGLQGNSLTQPQLQMVQHQVKQQLLKAQETTGKQGTLGPTKIYLAVQPTTPVGSTVISQPQTNLAPLTPIRAPPNNQVTQDQQSKAICALLQSNKQKNVPTSVLINGQDPLEPPAHVVLKPNLDLPSDKPQAKQTDLETKLSNEIDSAVAVSSANKFVITPDYIQQTIKNALKQENLNPEIEEKLLQLQKYQERQMKPDGTSNNGVGVVTTSSIRTISSSSSGPVPPSTSRRRPASSSRNTDDDEWVETTPRKRNRTIVHYDRHDNSDDSRPSGNVSRSRPSRSTTQVSHTPSQAPPVQVSSTPPSPLDERRRAAHHSRLPLLLFRHKELLKKDIIKKRGLLEKELGIEIQKELSAELALRTKAERNKQEEVRNTNIASSGNSSRRRSQQQSTSIKPVTSTPISTPSRSSKQRAKKEKLLCICQTPYDDTKFYVGCEHCNNWFHGDCVGITEEMSKSMSEFVCSECEHARDTQELYCLCRQPYDNLQFYICCDRCQDWFHGRCVGILQSEADNIDEYICPNCQKNNSVNFANMKELSPKDFENLKKLIKQIQMHRSAWPFMEPVDPREAPMYYKVIKEPMDLQIIEKKINEQSYNMLSELIGDMTKIFDNCRYFNPKDSQFYRCAEGLEAFFVQKIKFFREKLFESNQ